MSGQRTAAALLLSCALAACAGASAAMSESHGRATPSAAGHNLPSLRHERHRPRPSLSLLELSSSESDLRELTTYGLSAPDGYLGGGACTVARCASRSGRPFKLSRTVEQP
jgi:hypothetical protein